MFLQKLHIVEVHIRLKTRDSCCGRLQAVNSPWVVPDADNFAASFIYKYNRRIPLLIFHGTDQISVFTETAFPHIHTFVKLNTYTIY